MADTKITPEEVVTLVNDSPVRVKYLGVSDGDNILDDGDTLVEGNKTTLKANDVVILQGVISREPFIYFLTDDNKNLKVSDVNNFANNYVKTDDDVNTVKPTTTPSALSKIDSILTNRNMIFGGLFILGICCIIGISMKIKNHNLLIKALKK